MITELDSNFIPYSHNTKIGSAKNPLRTQSGCYCIEHTSSGKVYIGSTESLADRTGKNISALKYGRHKNKQLQSLYDLDPDIKIYIQPTNDVLAAQNLEQTTVDALKNSELLCNVAVNDVTKTRLGVKVPKEIVEKIVAANTGRKASEETKRKLSESRKGVILTEEHKKKLSEIHKNRLSTEEGKISHARGIDKLKHKVVCDGVEYESKSEAARQLGVDITTITHRCKNPNFPEYYLKG